MGLPVWDTQLISTHYCQCWSVFTARRYASAVYAMVLCPSVRPSICLSLLVAIFLRLSIKPKLLAVFCYKQSWLKYVRPFPTYEFVLVSSMSSAAMVDGSIYKRLKRLRCRRETVPYSSTDIARSGFRSHQIGPASPYCTRPYLRPSPQFS